MSLNVKNRMHRLNSESDMEWFARVYALQESRIAELEAYLDAMTARAAINGKEAVRYREALEKLARLGNGDHYGNSIGNQIAIRAITPDPQP